MSEKTEGAMKLENLQI